MEALNERIAELLEELNARTMRIYKASRAELFAKLDGPALRPLLSTPFTYREWKKVRVNIDGHYYSVPHPLIHEQVEVRVTCRGLSRRTACGRALAQLPARSPHDGGRAQAQGASEARSDPRPSGSSKRSWKREVYPEQSYRSCLGVLRLAKRYGAERLEAACARAMVAGARSYGTSSRS